MAKQVLDPARRAAILAAVQAEEDRRNAEWIQERLAAGRVTRLVTAPGELSVDAVARHRAEHPDEDHWLIIRSFVDAPPVRPDPPPIEPVAPVPHPWPDDPTPSGAIVYPRTGWL